ncbi:hypothetical protein HYQ46_005835 [Verticillium longisporum]|nr:hypothetical protein HYQ46_005835 [Verticillium longisporum]
MWRRQYQHSSIDNICYFPSRSVPDHYNKVGCSILNAPIIDILWQQALRCARVVAGQVHRRQVEEPCNDTVETNTTSTVRRDTNAAEDIDVLLDALRLGVDTLRSQPGLQDAGDVNTLATTEDLLATHEEVVGVGDGGIGGVLESVEGARRFGELVEDEEVGVVLLANEGAEGLLLRRRHVLIVRDVAVLLRALLAQELLALGKDQGR